MCYVSIIITISRTDKKVLNYQNGIIKCEILFNSFIVFGWILSYGGFINNMQTNELECI